MNLFYKEGPKAEIKEPFDYAYNENLIFHLSFDSYHFLFALLRAVLRDVVKILHSSLFS